MHARCCADWLVIMGGRPTTWVRTDLVLDSLTTWLTTLHCSVQQNISWLTLHTIQDGKASLTNKLKHLSIGDPTYVNVDFCPRRLVQQPTPWPLSPYSLHRFKQNLTSSFSSSFLCSTLPTFKSSAALPSPPQTPPHHPPSPLYSTP